MIDTGASFSITLTIPDFIWDLVLPACTSFNQLSGTTPVHREGPISWNIEDVKGTYRRIDTQAYYVPDATICLFFRQTYIANNNAKVKLVLNAKGTYLTLKCGTIMKFPLNPASNLPFMLTKAAVHSNCRRHNAANFYILLVIQLLISKINPVISFQCAWFPLSSLQHTWLILSKSIFRHTQIIYFLTTSKQHDTTRT